MSYAGQAFDRYWRDVFNRANADEENIMIHDGSYLAMRKNTPLVGEIFNGFTLLERDAAIGTVYEMSGERRADEIVTASTARNMPEIGTHCLSEHKP